MNNKYLVLQKLSDLVQEAPQPTQYQCIPRQLILLLPFDWTTIYEHLCVLETEGLVVLTQADNVQFSITQQGIDKVLSLESKTGKSIRIQWG
jgi:hypothetical protein